MIERSCPTCGGNGWITDEKECPVCRGRGYLGEPKQSPYGGWKEADTASCPVDHDNLLMLDFVHQGDGTWYRHCPHCGWIDVEWTAREYSKEALKEEV